MLVKDRIHPKGIPETANCRRVCPFAVTYKCLVVAVVFERTLRLLCFEVAAFSANHKCSAQTEC